MYTTSKSSDQEQQDWDGISGLNIAFGFRTLNGFRVWLRLNDFSSAVNLKRALKCSMCIIMKFFYFMHRTYFWRSERSVINLHAELFRS
jgi:hypothetical protein